MVKELLVPQEFPSATFKDFVAAAQGRYQEQKKKPWKVFSQAIDVPISTSERLWQMFTVNLPDYISQEIKQQLLATHPSPIIGFSVLVDPRLEKEAKIDYPEPVRKPRIRRNWKRGIAILNEIAVNFLTREILNKISSGSKSVTADFAELTRRAGEGINFDRKDLILIKECFKNDHQFLRFLEALSLAAVTGINDGVNRELALLDHESLDSFAVKIGKRIAGVESESESIFRYIYTPGKMSDALPGVINCPTIHGIYLAPLTAAMISLIQGAQLLPKGFPSMLSFTFFGILSTRLAIEFPARVYYGLIQEQIRYLSRDVHRTGIIPLKS